VGIATGTEDATGSKCLAAYLYGAETLTIEQRRVVRIYNMFEKIRDNVSLRLRKTSDISMSISALASYYTESQKHVTASLTIT